MKKSHICDFWFITTGTVIVGAAVFFFMVPSGIPIGGVTGLAMVLNGLVPVPVSVLTFVLNILLLLIGFLLIGREFGVKTVYTSILLPCVIAILERLFPEQHSVTGDSVMDAICFIFFGSIGFAILFLHRASSGGLDIVAKILNKYLRIDLGNAMSITGIVVAILSILTSDMKTVILSILLTYVSGIVLDHFIFSMDLKRKVCIISKKSEEICAYVLHELHSGATLYDAIGAYDERIYREVVAIVDNGEYTKLMKFIETTDPKAFITVYSVSAMKYQPKTRRDYSCAKIGEKG